VAVFVTEAPAKHAPMVCPLSKSEKSPIFPFFHMDCHSTQSPMHWNEHYNVKTQRTFSVANLFHCSQQKQILFLNFCFHYFVHPMYILLANFPYKSSLRRPHINGTLRGKKGRRAVSFQ
jgi:hypothetical protein